MGLYRKKPIVIEAHQWSGKRMERQRMKYFSAGTAISTYPGFRHKSFNIQLGVRGYGQRSLSLSMHIRYGPQLVSIRPEVQFNRAWRRPEMDRILGVTKR